MSKIKKIPKRKPNCTNLYDKSLDIIKGKLRKDTKKKKE